MLSAAAKHLFRDFHRLYRAWSVRYAKKYGGKVLPADASTIYTMQYVISSKLEKLYTFTVSNKVLAEFSEIMDCHMARFIDKKFNSLEMLELLG